MPRKNSCFTLAGLSLGLITSACSVSQDKKPEITETVQQASASVPVPAPTPAEIGRLIEMERQSAEKQRQCQDDKRRLELALKESQKRNDELQKKLNALLAIDREIRSREKAR